MRGHRFHDDPPRVEPRPPSYIAPTEQAQTAGSIASASFASGWAAGVRDVELLVAQARLEGDREGERRSENAAEAGYQEGRKELAEAEEIVTARDSIARALREVEELWNGATPERIGVERYSSVTAARGSLRTAQGAIRGLIGKLDA